MEKRLATGAHNKNLTATHIIYIYKVYIWIPSRGIIRPRDLLRDVGMKRAPTPLYIHVIESARSAIGEASLYDAMRFE